MVLLEGGDRRMTGRRAGRPSRHVGRQTTGDSAVHVEEPGERTGLDDLGRELPGLEQN